MSDKVLDLVIVGAGPAGLTASIYAQRAMLDSVVLEQAVELGEAGGGRNGIDGNHGESPGGSVLGFTGRGRRRAGAGRSSR